MDILGANKFYKISLFVLLFYSVKIVTCTQKRWKRKIDFDGKFSTSGSAILARSRIDCGKSCLDNDTCLSFFFLDEFFCYLRDDVLNSVDGLQDLEKAAYYVLYEGEPDTTTAPPSSTAPSVSAPTFTCPPDDSIFRTIILSDGQLFTYKVVKTQTSQSDARTACSNQGAFLARVKTVAKMNMLRNLIFNCTGYFGSTDYYVDGSNNYYTDEDEKHWTFYDGSYVPMSNYFWGPSYPNNPETENCLRMRAEADFMWDDCNCIRQYYFICEK